VFQISGCGLGDCPIARELPRAGHIQNCLPCPRVGVRRELAEPLIGIEIGIEIRQMHVAATVLKQRVMNGRENPRLVAAEVVVGDQLQCGSRFLIIVVMPAGLYHTRPSATCCVTDLSAVFGVSRANGIAGNAIFDKLLP
jgi:hypothetical protein